MTQAETTAIRKHSNLLTNTHKSGETYDEKGMKTMAIVLYALSYTGIVIQVTDIVPGIPDRITTAVIVMGLVAANMIQWRQAIKDREDFRNRTLEQQKIHRDEIKEQNENIMKMVESNSRAIQEIFKSIK